MYYNNQYYKTSLLHIPRNGAASMAQSLRGGAPGPPTEIREYDECITILRNPYTRFISLYTQLKTLGKFKGSLMDLANRVDEDYFYLDYLKPQTQYLSGRISKIYTLEKINDMGLDYAILPYRFNITRYGMATLDREDLYDFYNIIGELYEEDLNLWMFYYLSGNEK